MDRRTGSPSSTELVLPLFAAVCAVLSLLILVSSGFGSRAGLWGFRTGFSLLAAAAYSGLGCAILAVISGVIAVRRRRKRSLTIALAALIAALIAVGLPYSWRLKAQRYPRIHDISTDVTNPPVFVAVLPLRKGPVTYPGPAVAAQQLSAYPDVRTVLVPLPKDQTFQKALEVAREMGWRIVAAVPAEGRIEATATTFWFGFKDDVVIRLTPAGERTALDVRSVSRVGISDLGTNAERIRTFSAKLSEKVK